MNKSRGNEKGAIIIEIIAVIALLGVLGPLLFRQVLSRNEEVENINIASEVRAVKEAFSAYILTNKQALLKRNGCMELPEDTLNNYLPYGMDNAADSYDLILCVIADPPPFIEGFIVPNEGSLPEKMGLKRSARIANIIGADGGIYQGSDIDGVAGGWHVSGSDLEDNFLELDAVLKQVMQSTGITAVYVATTGMDTYVPEYVVEDYSSGFVTIPDNLAFQRLHAAEYFSVSNNPNCYTKKHQTMQVGAEGYTALDDEIYSAGDVVSGNKCDPLFWVGTSGGAGDKFGAGMVYAKNGMVIGHHEGENLVSSVGIFSSSDTLDAEDKNRIEVYDNTGKAKVIINGKGEIISKTERLLSADETSLTSDEVETLTIANGAITSNIKAEKSGESAGINLPYKVDPAYTSVMKDIRLESRGGARLSEILPNYISKTIQSISESGNVTMPTCPNGYAPAIIVTPVNWEKIKITPSDVKELYLKTNSATTVEADAMKDHTHEIKQLTVLASDEAEMENSGLIIKIDSDEDGYNQSNAGVPGKWSVKFSYPRSDMADRTDVKAIAQTFCVYDNFENDSGENKYNKDSSLER